jgi:hypothetical protein
LTGVDESQYTAAAFDALSDAAELVLLSDLQAKRAAEARVSSTQTAGVKSIFRGAFPVPATPTAVQSPSTNGTPAAAPSPPTATLAASDPAAEITDDAAPIINRSPVTNNHNHYYPQPAATVSTATPTVTPAAATTRPLWPWLLAIPLLIGGGAFAAWLLKPTPAAPTPVVPTLVPGKTTIGVSGSPGS